MICSIHQPNYIPYLGLFQKINQSDIFVFYDNAQYTKGDYHNRNSIKTANGEVLLTIPVQIKLGDKINEVQLNKNILQKHLKTIEQSYKKSPYFEEIYPFIQELYAYDGDSLSMFNENIIVKICEYLDIKCSFLRLSEILPNLETQSTQALIDICKTIGAKEYISGSGGKKYITESDFKKNNIKLVFQNFKHPEYKQLWGDFRPYMSILDLLFNEGKNSKNFLNIGKNDRL